MREKTEHSCLVNCSQMSAECSKGGGYYTLDALSCLRIIFFVLVVTGQSYYRHAFTTTDASSTLASLWCWHFLHFGLHLIFLGVSSFKQCRV